MIEAKRVASPNSNDPLFTPTRSFPVYDGHGNMIATLARPSAGGYSLANEKRYDVWGVIGRGSLPPTHARIRSLPAAPRHGEEQAANSTYGVKSYDGNLGSHARWRSLPAAPRPPAEGIGTCLE